MGTAAPTASDEFETKLLTGAPAGRSPGAEGSGREEMALNVRGSERARAAAFVLAEGADT